MEKRGWQKKQPSFNVASSLDIHRALPQSAEAEQGVLGSMLISPRQIIGEMIELMGTDGEWFYHTNHQTIYVILVELWRENKSIDLITFTQILRDRNILETVGGAAFITSIFTFVPTAANVTYYAEIVRDKFILRKIIETETENIRRAFEEQDQVNALLDEVESTTLAIRPRDRALLCHDMKESVMRGIDRIEAVYENRGALSGLATGFADLDRMTSGLQNSDMIVIAARPSMGKTSLGMNIAEHVAINEKLPVAIFSLEMSEQQLIDRLLCSRARINLQKVRDGFLADRDFPALTSAAARLADAPIFIDDQKITSDVLIARARRLKADKGIRLIVVDYLQLLRKQGFKANERQAEVAAMSGDLKGLAKELNLPIIVLAQLNRNPEGRAGGRPRLSDLRESGAIEQDSDVVGLLMRPEVYEEDEDRKCELAGEAELIIAKHRNGPLGEIALTFLKEFTRFEDRARNVSEPY